MANQYSRSDCKTCASYRDGLACGVCTERATNIKDSQATRTRKEKRRRDRSMEGAVRRSQKPGQAATGFVVGLPQRAWVRCDNGHSWQTMTTSDRDRPVEEPQCGRCEQYFTQIHFTEATMAEEVNCTANCWNAEEYQCVCSCGRRQPWRW